MLNMILTKVKGLDELFGGYLVGVLHGFGGETGSGKTHLTSYWPIIRIYQELTQVEGRLHEQQKFIVLDGDGGFDLDRFRQICRANKVPFEDIVNKHLVYKEIVTLSEQNQWIREIVPKKIEEEHIQPLYIVADPMIVHYRAKILGTPRKYRLAEIGESTGKIAGQLITIRQIAVKYKIPACITSWTAGNIEITTEEESELGISAVFREKTPFIGGRAMGYMPKVIVILGRPIRELPLRMAYLYKHRSRPDGIVSYFTITNGGLEDAPTVSYTHLTLPTKA